MNYLYKALRKIKNIGVRYFFYSTACSINSIFHNKFNMHYSSFLFNKKDEAVLMFIRKKYKTLIAEYRSKAETAQPFVDSSTAPIWICWLQGEQQMPPLVSYLVSRVKQFSGSHPVCVVTLENIDRYVQMPDKVRSLYCSGKICAAHFTDVLRCLLLEKYGGLWVDSTLYFHDAIPEEIFRNTIWSIKGRDLSFEFGKICIAADEWTGYCQAAQPHSLYYKFVNDFFNQYFEEFDYVFEYLTILYVMKIAREEIKAVADEYSQISINNSKCEMLWPILKSAKSNDAKLASMKELFKSQTNIYKLSYKDSYANSKNSFKTIDLLKSAD